jgi:hypothetical protein
LIFIAFFLQNFPQKIWSSCVSPTKNNWWAQWESLSEVIDRMTLSFQTDNVRWKASVRGKTFLHQNPIDWDSFVHF